MNDNINLQKEDFSDISLLYPDALNIQNENGISSYDAARLEFDELLNLQYGEIGDYFTSSKEIIEYRQKTVNDVIENPDLCKVLTKMLPYLSDIAELRTLSSDKTEGDGYLYSITEAEIYNSLMGFLQTELLPYTEKVTSPAMQELCRRIEILTEGEYYKNLSKKLSELSQRVRDIKSVTIGVNLDAGLKPESSGVISVNSEPFKGGDFFERVMRLEFKKSEMTCIANLIPYTDEQNENQKEAMVNAFNSALSDVFKSSLKEWKSACKYYVLENTDFLIRIAPEIEFLTKSAKLIEKLKSLDCPVSFPEIKISSDKALNVKGLCNPVIALKTEKDIVPNDLFFDENGTIFVITGPNRGGKSVITCALGHAALMAGLGLPVCAEKMELSPFDKILTHFPGDSSDTVDRGRLGEECSRLEAIFNEVTEQSLVLLDESLSSTGSYEASYIASEILSGFSIIGCRALFSTHLHDLAAAIEKINERTLPLGGVKIDSLVAEVKSGERSFKIIRKTPDGKSYASDIAEKYGLSFEKINEKIAKKQG